LELPDPNGSESGGCSMFVTNVSPFDLKLVILMIWIILVPWQYLHGLLSLRGKFRVRVFLATVLLMLDSVKKLLF